MTLRLTDEETEALRRKASDEGRSMQEVARSAINRYTRNEDMEFRALVQAVVDRDRVLLDRLGDITPSADTRATTRGPLGDETVTDQSAR